MRLPAVLAAALLVGCVPDEPDDLPPTAPVIELRPAVPLAAEWLDVLLVTPSTDPEGEAVEHRLRWTRDGVDVPEADDLVAVWPELTLAGEVWSVAVAGVEPSGRAGAEAVASVTIQGSMPSISGVALLPPGPTIVDTLTASPRDWEDADGDPPMYRFEWFVNDEPAGTTDTLTTDRFAEGDVVQVVATPFDALLDGEAVPSQPATIRVADACFALSFDGVDDHVVFDGFLQNLTDDFTIEAWVAPEDTGTDRVIVSTGAWHVLVDADDRVALEIDGLRAVANDPVPLDGQAHHVAVVRRGEDGLLSLWIDGVAQSSGKFPGAGENAVLHLGRFADSEAGWFAGTIDDVRLGSLPRYSNPFTPRRYWASDGFTTGLWHFPEGEGVESEDATGGRRTANLVGPGWTQSPTACTVGE